MLTAPEKEERSDGGTAVLSVKPESLSLLQPACSDSDG